MNKGIKVINIVIENNNDISITDKDISNVQWKINAIIENLTKIEDYSNTGNYPLTRDNVESIEIDLDVAYDEFTITGDFKSGSTHYANSPYIDKDNFLMLEVVTREVAIGNDMDFIEDEQSKAQYVLGGEHSMYEPLGTSEYWYRLL